MIFKIRKRRIIPTISIPRSEQALCPRPSLQECDEGLKDLPRSYRPPELDWALFREALEVNNQCASLQTCLFSHLASRRNWKESKTWMLGVSKAQRTDMATSLISSRSRRTEWWDTIAIDDEKWCFTPTFNENVKVWTLEQRPTENPCGSYSQIIVCFLSSGSEKDCVISDFQQIRHKLLDLGVGLSVIIGTVFVSFDLIFSIITGFFIVYETTFTFIFGFCIFCWWKGVDS